MAQNGSSLTMIGDTLPIVAPYPAVVVRRGRQHAWAMKLRDALDLCSDEHSHDWVEMPSGGWGRPASAMLAGIFDPGGKEPDTRPLAGHSIAVYELDARLSLIWPLPVEHEHDRFGRERWVPEWAEKDTHEWKNARDGWAVVLLGGAPIWQARIWYLDWGSGIGGYVPDFEEVHGDREPGELPKLVGWETSAWAVGLVRLINSFSPTSDWVRLDPTPRVAPSPSPVHPVDAARGGY
jgi:hypothetical protein